MYEFITNTFRAMSYRLRIPIHHIAVLASLLAVSLVPNAAKSQVLPTNAGTSFQLCFERNHDTVNINNGVTLDSGYCDIEIATLDAPSKITITSKHYPALHQTFTLDARATKVFRVSDSCPDIWINATDNVDDRVVLVTATNPIICYGMNHKYETTDDFLALPDNYAGTDYRIMSYANSNNASIAPDYMPSQFAVSAISDSTTVSITPSVQTATGHPAGAPFTTLLMAGECIQVQTDASITGLDLTGSIVQSDKPVVAFGSHARAEVPVGFLNPQGQTSRNHLTEEMPPTDAWGKVFVLSAIDTGDNSGMNPNGDLMRVLALNDSTSVSINGIHWVTLNRNQFVDSLIHGGVVVEGSDALLVGEYGHTTTSLDAIGDPFFAIIPPVDQTFNDYTFFASNDPVFIVNEVMIAADSLCLSNIVLDGAALPSSFFSHLPVSVGGRSFAVVDIGVNRGSHRITTTAPPQSAFTILSHGLGNVDAYGSSGGFLLKPVRTLYLQAPIAQNKYKNQVTFNNTTHWPVIVDSFQFVPNDISANVYGIHVSQGEMGQLAVAQTGTINLVATMTPTVPVSGKVKIFTHTAEWSDIEPAVINFVFHTEGEGVDAVAQGQIALSNYPNPFSSFTTISFSLPSEDNVTLTLFDGLGHVVRHIASGPFAAGSYNIRLDRRDLPSGFYICEVTSDRLHIHERMPLLAGE
jgi:hypothetical protein